MPTRTVYTSKDIGDKESFSPDKKKNKSDKRVSFVSNRPVLGTQNNNLAQVVNHHISLGVESIYSIMVGGLSLSTVSFNSILDTIMMLVQVPVIFVLYEKSEFGFERKCFSIQKSKHTKVKIENLVDAFKEHEKVRFEKSLIPIWDKPEDAKYWVLIIKNKAVSYEVLEIVSSINDIRSIWDMAGYKIMKIFDPNYYLDVDIDDFLSLLINTVKNRLDYEKKKIDGESNKAFLEKAGVRSEIELLGKTEFGTFLKGIKENTTQYKISGQGVVDAAYEKLTRNLVAVSNIHNEEVTDDAKIPNFLLFVRDYNVHDGYSRYKKTYDYRVRILVCSKQREDFKRNLKWIAKNKNKRKEIYLKQVSQSVNSDEIDSELRLKYEELSHQANEEFFKKIDSLEGIDEILDILEKPYGETTRSMSDRVFDSSISLYRDPFSSNASLLRIFSARKISELPADKFSDLENEQRDDVLRTVVVQYLIESMAHKPFDKKLNLWITLSPIQISGAIWGVAGYVVRTLLPENILNKSKQISEYNKSWLRNYQVYQTVSGGLKRNLRVYLSKYYEQFVSEVYSAWAIELHYKMGLLIEESHKEQLVGNVDLIEELKKLNSRLRSLSRIFPYDVVQIKLIPYDKVYPFPNNSSPAQAFFARNLIAEISMENNEKFPNEPVKLIQANDKLFIDSTRIAISITDAFLRRIAENTATRYLPSLIREEILSTNNINGEHHD